MVQATPVTRGKEIMSKKPRCVWIAASVALFAWALYAAAQSAKFQIEETTIAALHRAILRRELSCGPGGSSGGSGIAVAANLTLVALSEETGVSIRNPAANNNIVGTAPTQGLVSRAGVIPISFTQDRVGAYARTAADAAR
jgi:amidase